MALTIKFYSDPGHGWGAVKRKVLDDLGIAHKISSYSYQRGQTVYLEEDCDLSVLTTAMALKGETFKYWERHTNSRSPIRNYESYKA